jgi:hypothetical protein
MMSLILIELLIFGFSVYINSYVLLTHKLSFDMILYINLITGLLLLNLSHDYIHIISLIIIVGYNIMNNYHVYHLIQYYSNH